MADSFQFFPRLPLELRLKVWAIELDAVPRRVRVSCTKGSQQIGIRKSSYVARFHDVDKKLPPLLSVNHESRFESLNYYSRLFKSPTLVTTNYGFIEPSEKLLEPAGYIDSYQSDGIYFRPDVDILCIEANLLTHIPTQEKLYIKYMRVLVKDALSFSEYHMEELRSCIALKHLTLLCDYTVASWGGPLDYMQRLVEDFEVTKEEHNWDITIAIEPAPDITCDRQRRLQLI